jgi:hypothetical protein
VHFSQCNSSSMAGRHPAQVAVALLRPRLIGLELCTIGCSVTSQKALDQEHSLARRSSSGRSCYLFVVQINWSEIAKWGSWASAAVGLFAITLGWRFAKAHEHRQWRNQKLTEKRLQIFDEAAVKLNDLLCFWKEVGNWKELNPPSLVMLKRRLDKTIHVNEALFSDRLRAAYFNFIQACFKTFNGPGRDAKLRMAPKCDLPTWQKEWESCFCTEPSDQTPVQIIEQKYNHLMKMFAKEIGVN